MNSIMMKLKQIRFSIVLASFRIFCCVVVSGEEITYGKELAFDEELEDDEDEEETSLNCIRVRVHTALCEPIRFTDFYGEVLILGYGLRIFMASTAHRHMVYGFLRPNCHFGHTVRLAYGL